jgi:hypothetical protein
VESERAQQPYRPLATAVLGILLMLGTYAISYIEFASCLENADQSAYPCGQATWLQNSKLFGPPLVAVAVGLMSRSRALLYLTGAAMFLVVVGEFVAVLAAMNGR